MMCFNRQFILKLVAFFLESNKKRGLTVADTAERVLKVKKKSAIENPRHRPTH